MKDKKNQNQAILNIITPSPLPVETTLYHIKCNQTIAILTLRPILDKLNIDNFLYTGGIHVHLTPNQVRQVKDIALTVNSKLELGVLPAIQKSVNRDMADNSS